jgi:hypothetical protein
MMTVKKKKTIQLIGTKINNPRWKCTSNCWPAVEKHIQLIRRSRAGSEILLETKIYIIMHQLADIYPMTELMPSCQRAWRIPVLHSAFVSKRHQDSSNNNVTAFTFQKLCCATFTYRSPHSVPGSKSRSSLVSHCIEESYLFSQTSWLAPHSIRGSKSSYPQVFSPNVKSFSPSFWSLVKLPLPPPPPDA